MVVKKEVVRDEECILLTLYLVLDETQALHSSSSNLLLNLKLSCVSSGATIIKEPNSLCLILTARKLLMSPDLPVWGVFTPRWCKDLFLWTHWFYESSGSSGSLKRGRNCHVYLNESLRKASLVDLFATGSKHFGISGSFPPYKPRIYIWFKSLN